MDLLLIPYIANILILVPVVCGTLTNVPNMSGGKFAESVGWRQLAGSLWTGVLVLSILGLWKPVTFTPILLFQVIYKTTFLLAYVVPRLWTPAKRQEIHWGMTVPFVLIVLAYPFFIPWEALLSPFGNGPFITGVVPPHTAPDVI